MRNQPLLAHIESAFSGARDNRYQPRTNPTHRRCACAAAWALALVVAAPAVAQLTEADIAALRARGEREGWTFTVSLNEATQYPLEQLCGLVEPPNWRDDEPAYTGETSGRELPAYFDWRDYGGVTPIRNQGGCGSCWAFAAMGTVESAILRLEGLSVDLSEQWLVSCTGAGTCDGGWHKTAAGYMKCSTFLADSCGQTGAVKESSFGYVAADAACGCPYVHPHCLDSWTPVANSVSAIKQAIYYHGPVATSVNASGAFHGYDSGVFNDCQDDSTNHAVVLVGWDDTMGSNGVWILRNSWGSWWGEGGYMYIEYGCSRIGSNAMYVSYSPPDCNGNDVPDSLDIADGTSTDCNNNGVPDECDLETGVSLDCNGNGISDDCDIADGTSLDCNDNGVPDSCDLTAGTSPDCNANGIPDECDIAPGSGADCNANGVPDVCDLADGICQDCNANGVPDECELAISPEDDCNHNGVPDECEMEPRDGLAGAYFDNPDLLGTPWGRVDASVAFDWGSASPRLDWTSTSFAVRWTGYVLTTAAAGEYTFYTYSDDGVRLWVADQLLIDKWNDQPATEWSGSLELVANGAYPVTLEYYSDDGASVAVLSWQPPGGAKQVVPSENLFPGWDCDGNGRLDACDFAPLVSVASEPLAPLGGEAKEYTLAAPLDAASDVTLTFSALGDLRYSSEYVTVYLNGTSLGNIYTGIVFSCEPNQIDTIMLTAADYNALKAGGDVVITMAPSAGVNPLACGGASSIQVTVSYDGMAPGLDCNGNGIQDQCDIASGISADLNDDGIPDECVTPPSCPGDLNCDGIVNYDDIDPFVEALSAPGGAGWSSPCPWLNADCDNSGAVNYGDIDLFVQRIGAGCH